MIVLMAAGWASVPASALVDAARLVVDERTLEGVDGVVVRAALERGIPWVEITNTASEPLEIRWDRSTLTPPNGEPGPLVALRASDPDPRPPVQAPPPVVLGPHESGTWALFPAAWIDDGPANDREQVLSWSQTSFSGVELALARGEDVGRYRALWRTEYDTAALEPLRSLHVQRAGEPPPGGLGVSALPKSMDDERLERRRRWDAAYRGYRRQARTARSVWVTGAVVGGLCALATAQALRGMADAPDEGPDPSGYTRTDYRDAAILYGGLTALSAGVTIPMLTMELRATRKLRELGPRP